MYIWHLQIGIITITQKLLKLVMLISVPFHRIGCSWMSYCSGNYWSPTTLGHLSGHSCDEEKNGALQGPRKTMAGSEHAYNNSNLISLLKNSKAGSLASQNPRFRPGTNIHYHLRTHQDLCKSEVSLSQPPAGVSTTVCLNHFHHQNPSSFSLLQLSWLQHC